MSRDQHVAQIPPGDLYVCHVWEGVRLIVAEVPNKLKEEVDSQAHQGGA